MAFFAWLGGPLDSPFSWTQPDPLNPVVPGAGDTVTIAGGALTGSLVVLGATLAGDLSGSITSGSVSISAITIEAGAALKASAGETISLSVAQKGGSNTIG